MISFSEEQAVSSRWWALTRSQIPSTSETWKDEFMMGLDNIFSIASWAIGRLEDFNIFKQKLSAIFEVVKDLRLALAEKVISIDLEVNVTRPNVPFDHWWMQDVYGETPAKSGVIAGMMGIGLKKIV